MLSEMCRFARFSRRRHAVLRRGGALRARPDVPPPAGTGIWKRNVLCLPSKNYVQAESLEQALAAEPEKEHPHFGRHALAEDGQKQPWAPPWTCARLGLDAIEEDETQFSLGAMVTLRQLEQHPGLNAYTGDAAEKAVRDIVGVQFRNMATVGGSVWGRFGFSDVLTLLLAMDMRRGALPGRRGAAGAVCRHGLRPGPAGAGAGAQNAGAVCLPGHAQPAHRPAHLDLRGILPGRRVPRRDRGKAGQGHGAAGRSRHSFRRALRRKAPPPLPTFAAETVPHRQQPARQRGLPYPSCPGADPAQPVGAGRCARHGTETDF